MKERPSNNLLNESAGTENLDEPQFAFEQSCTGIRKVTRSSPYRHAQGTLQGGKQTVASLKTSKYTKDVK